MDVINTSFLFDEKYYMKRYEDIGRRQNDPLRHFVRHGHMEGRNPNAFFDTEYYRNRYLKGDKRVNPLFHYITSKAALTFKTSEFFDGAYYLKKYPDVVKSGMNPLSHFIVHGLDEGRTAIPSSIHTRISEQNLVRPIIDLSKIKVTIIVPVFNAIDETEACLDSIIRLTPLSNNIQLLVLNDKSSLPTVKKRLLSYKNFEYVRVKNNFKNIGYTRNVNKGLRIAKEQDVILLNSDTIVTANWLRNLMVTAYSAQDVGTVTALSNGAGAFSVPKPGMNSIPENLDIDSIGRILGNLNEESINVPTGNGFCMYIKRDLINDIGFFDEVKFPRGYGEENDFCMRALENGWKNLVAPKVFVYHKRSASFKESKLELVNAGVSQVKQDFPEYQGAIKSIAKSSTFQNIRSSLEQKFNALNRECRETRPKLMFVISTRTGGTPQTNWDLMRQLRDIYDCIALASNSEVIEILRAGDEGYELIEKYQLNEPVKFATHKSAEYDRLVKYLLYKYNVDLLHIRHMAWHSLSLPKLAKDLFIPVVCSFHDFYTICPSVNLIDGNGKYHENGVQTEAPNPLWRDETVQPINSEMLKRWKSRNSKALSICDYYVTTSQSTKDLITKNLNLKDANVPFSVIPHGRDFSVFRTPVSSNTLLTKLKILVPGNISLSKGAELIKQIKAQDKKNMFEFHVIGTCDEALKEFVVYHGRYKRNEFTEIVDKIKPHLAAILSIWPETYCHTLTESWAAGLPVLGLAYGAVGERIEQHGAGWLAENDVKSCTSVLNQILSSSAELNKKNEYVEKWQNGFGKSNNVSKMTGRYLDIYLGLLTKKQKANPKSIGFLMKGCFPNVPPTAYVRLIDWKTELEAEHGKNIEYVVWQDIFAGNFSRFETIFIQRDAIPSYAVDWCLEALSEMGVPYIYEIDDNLLDVPPEIDTDKVYSQYRPFFVKLIKSACAVHVTNDALKETLSSINPNIVVRPNKIIPHMWHRSKDNVINLEKNGEQMSVLYYGSRTHQKELDFLQDIIADVNKNAHRVHLYVVGCGELNSNGHTTRLVPPSSKYDSFVEWLTQISHNFHLGVVPLLDAPFSRNKSYLKVLEMRALELQVLCSDIYPYTELKEQAVDNVEFMENLKGAWVLKLTELLEKGQNEFTHNS